MNLGPRKGLRDLRKEIASRQDVEIDQVMLTTGVSMGISAALGCLGGFAFILIPRPYYPAYLKVARLMHLRVGYYDLLPGKKWQPDLGQITKKVNCETRAIVINSPGNPTGGILTDTFLEGMASVLGRRRIQIICDESQWEFLYEDVSLADPRHYFDSRQVIKLRGFSKSLMMPGERLGYAIAHPDVIKSLDKAHWHLALTPPLRAQYIALERLKSEQGDGTGDLLLRLRKRRDLALAILKTSDRIRAHSPEGGIFIWFTVDGCTMNSVALAKACEQHAGVKVIGGTVFGVTEPAYLRASFAVPCAELIAGFESLVRFLNGLA